MQKKSLSSLLLILISAVLLFIIAVFWKLTQVDNSEPITVIEIKKNITKKVTKNITNNVEPTLPIKPFYKQESPPVKDSLNTREAIEEHYKDNYFLARLRTPEDLVAAYKTLKNKGNYDMADKVLDKLEYVFPDYEFVD